MSRNRLGTMVTAAALVLLPLATSGCTKEAPPEPEKMVRPVKTMVVGGTERGALVFPGQTQASDRSLLSFRVPGQLVEFPVNEGDHVRRGQLIARLDPTDYELAVQRARASFQKAQADYDRYKRLYEREAVPLAELEMRRAMRDVARAELEQAQAELGYTRLFAPYTGWVGQKLVENFETVKAGQAIVSLQNLEVIEIVLDIPEDLMARARRGQTIGAVARFEAAPGRTFPLTFKEATAQADPRTQTYQVTFTMKQPEGITILPGMTAEVSLQVSLAGEESRDGRSMIAVPVSAVFSDTAGTPQVWVVDTGTMTVHRRAVTLGEPTGQGEVWITGGLEPGETIVLTAVQQLEEGEQIRNLPESY